MSSATPWLWGLLLVPLSAGGKSPPQQEYWKSKNKSLIGKGDVCVPEVVELLLCQFAQFWSCHWCTDGLSPFWWRCAQKQTRCPLDVPNVLCLAYVPKLRAEGGIEENVLQREWDVVSRQLREVSCVTRWGFGDTLNLARRGDGSGKPISGVSMAVAVDGGWARALMMLALAVFCQLLFRSGVRICAVVGVEPMLFVLW